MAESWTHTDEACNLRAIHVNSELAGAARLVSRLGACVDAWRHDERRWLDSRDVRASRALEMHGRGTTACYLAGRHHASFWLD